MSTENKGYFKCPRCHKRFENEKELQQHFSENTVCDDYAQYLLAKIKFELIPKED